MSSQQWSNHRREQILGQNVLGNQNRHIACMRNFFKSSSPLTSARRKQVVKMEPLSASHNTSALCLLAYGMITCINTRKEPNDWSPQRMERQQQQSKEIGTCGVHRFVGFAHNSVTLCIKPMSCSSASAVSARYVFTTSPTKLIITVGDSCKSNCFKTADAFSSASEVACALVRSNAVSTSPSGSVSFLCAYATRLPSCGFKILGQHIKVTAEDYRVCSLLAVWMLDV